MLSSSASALLRLAGWSYLPNFATQRVLPLIHHLLRRIGHTPPARGTPAYAAHYRRTFAAVVLGYLLYNLVEALRSTPDNFYQTLSVGPHADDNELKLAFRAFAKKNHPDRVGSQGEALFIAVRDAFESLKDPVTRFAYDRFGPDAMTWQQCSTTRDYLNRGLIQSSGFYIVSGVILLALSTVGRPSPVAFWRYLLFTALFATEMSLTFSSSTQSAGLLSVLFPRRVAYQHVLFLHQVFMFLSVAISHVIPALFPDDRGGDHDRNADRYRPLLDRISELSSVVDREVSRMLNTDLHAMHGVSTSATFHTISSSSTICVPSDAVMEALSHEMEDMIIETRLHNVGPLRSLWDAAVARGQQRRELELFCAKEEEDEIRGQGALPSPPDDTFRGRLPSPRPSPPPRPSPHKQSSYVRGRSMSWC